MSALWHLRRHVLFTRKLGVVAHKDTVGNTIMYHVNA